MDIDGDGAHNGPRPRSETPDSASSSGMGYHLMSNHELVQHAIAACMALVEKDSMHGDDCDLDAIDTLAKRAEKDNEAWVELVAALVNMNVTNAVPLISMIVDIVALPSAGATAALTRKLLSFVNEGDEVQARNSLIIWRALTSKLAGQRCVALLSHDVLAALMTLLDPERPPVLLLHAILTLEGFAGTGTNKKRIMASGIRSRLQRIVSAYTRFRTCELSRRYADSLGDVPAMAPVPRGGCVAAPRHEDCCPANCAVNHLHNNNSGSGGDVAVSMTSNPSGHSSSAPPQQPNALPQVHSGSSDRLATSLSSGSQGSASASASGGGSQFRPRTCSQSTDDDPNAMMVMHCHGDTDVAAGADQGNPGWYPFRRPSSPLTATGTRRSSLSFADSWDDMPSAAESESMAMSEDRGSGSNNTGSGPILILSGTEHNLYNHSPQVPLSPREQMILSYAQEQYPHMPPPFRLDPALSPTSSPLSAMIQNSPPRAPTSPLAHGRRLGSPSPSSTGPSPYHLRRRSSSSGSAGLPPRRGSGSGSQSGGGMVPLAYDSAASPVGSTSGEATYTRRSSRTIKPRPRPPSVESAESNMDAGQSTGNMSAMQFNGKFRPDRHGRYGGHVDVMTSSQADYMMAEVVFCAEWSLNNIFVEKGDVSKSGPPEAGAEGTGTSEVRAMLSWRDMTKFLKLSSDGLEARNDEMTFESVRSTMSVTQGKWYYEVTVLTSGIMQIGWATRDCEYLSEEGGGIGDDVFSYALDGCRLLKWHEARGTSVELASAWVPGDCVSFYLNLDEGFIAFAVDGTLTCGFQHVQRGDDTHWHAAASFMAAQHCRFNFGSEPFRFGPPPGYQVFNDHGTLTEEEKYIVPRFLRPGQAGAILDDSDADFHDMCGICYERPPTTELQPCGHSGFCLECARLCDACPLCRTPIASHRTSSARADSSSQLSGAE